MSQEDVIVLSSDDQSEEGEIIDESSINEHTSVQAKLMRALNLNPGQVPEYIMRMVSGLFFRLSSHSSAQYGSGWLSSCFDW